MLVANRFIFAVVLFIACPGALGWQQKREHRLLGTCTRREVLFGGVSTVALVLFPSSAAQAGEVGARINQAVTQSDLGISVRRSVVKGAQVMDRIDQKWEQFSDENNLGAARSQQTRPGKKIIPDPKPLDSATASRILEVCDKAFLASTNKAVRQAELEKQIELVSENVLPSFQRQGLSPDAGSALRSGDEFNFASYTHFKAYTDLIVDRGIDFRSFKKAFESKAGRDLTELILTTNQQSPFYDSKSASLSGALDSIFAFCEAAVQRGLVARIDDVRGSIDPEKIEEWSQGQSELSWSLALDGDVTLGAQCLLQEQGFLLYPSYVRYAVQYILLNSIKGQVVNIEDYYMDTEYNSNPDKFQVREVLLNIEIDSAT